MSHRAAKRTRKYCKRVGINVREVILDREEEFNIFSFSYPPRVMESFCGRKMYQSLKASA